MLRNRRLPATLVARRLAEVRNVVVSARTIRRRLREYGLVSRRPSRGPELLAEHRVARLQFVRQHINWDMGAWESVLFTDESRFALRSADGRERVWRRRGERYEAGLMLPRVPFNGGSLMVWAGVSIGGRTELVFIDNGTMMAPRYIEQCIFDLVVPYAPFIGDNFILMQDNARPHTVRDVSLVLNAVGIHVMDWPSRSPDMNPIEHVWDMLDRKIHQ